MSGPFEKSGNSCLISAGILGGLLIVVALGVFLPWQTQMAEYDDRIETLSSQLARFEGMRGTRPQLEEEYRLLREKLTKAEFFLDAATPALAAAALQNRVKEVVNAQGGSLVSTQNVEEAAKEKPSRIAVRVRMNGDDAALLKVLYELEGGRPQLFVDNVSVRAHTKARGRGDARNVETQLDIQFDLIGFLREEQG